MRYMFLITYVILFSAYNVHVFLCHQIVEIRISINNTALLPCNNTAGNRAVEWIRKYKEKESTTYTIGWTINNHLRSRERLRIAGPAGGERYDLEISKAVKADSGIYSCAVRGINGTMNYNYLLEVTDELDSIHRTEVRFSGDIISTDTHVFNPSQNDYLSTFVPVDNRNSSNPSVLSGVFSYQTYLFPSASGCGIIIIIMTIVLFSHIRRKKTITASAYVPQQTSEVETVTQENYTYYEEINGVADNLPLSNETVSNSNNSGSSAQRSASGDVVEYEPLNENLNDDFHTYQECGNTSEAVNHLYDECDKDVRVPNVYQSLMEERSNSVHIYD